MVGSCHSFRHCRPSCGRPASLPLRCPAIAVPSSPAARLPLRCFLRKPVSLRSARPLASGLCLIPFALKIRYLTNPPGEVTRPTKSNQKTVEFYHRGTSEGLREDPGEAAWRVGTAGILPALHARAGSEGERVCGSVSL